MAKKILAVKVYPGHPIPPGYTAGKKLRSGIVIYTKEVDLDKERKEVDDLSDLFGSMGFGTPEVIVAPSNTGLNALIAQMGNTKIGGKRKSRKHRKSIKKRNTKRRSL